MGSSFAKSFYLQFLYDAASVCCIAETTEGQIVGCGTAKVVLRRDDCTGGGVLEREGHILTLAVDPAWRRKGIGRDLLEVHLRFLPRPELLAQNIDDYRLW